MNRLGSRLGLKNDSMLTVIGKSWTSSKYNHNIHFGIYLIIMSIFFVEITTRFPQYSLGWNHWHRILWIHSTTTFLKVHKHLTMEVSFPLEVQWHHVDFSDIWLYISFLLRPSSSPFVIWIDLNGSSILFWKSESIDNSDQFIFFSCLFWLFIEYIPEIVKRK